MTKKYREITEVVQDAYISELDLCGNIDDMITRLENLKKIYRKYNVLKIKMYAGYTDINIELIGTRLETEEERNKRLAAAKKKREKRKKEETAEEERERELYEKLKKKFKDK